MRPNERKQKIIEIIRLKERVSVDNLSQILHTSQETIRRDLNDLSKNGLVQKYHGGATLPPQSENENAFKIRMNEFAQEKRLLARYAASLFQPGDSIFIDTGTTTLFFARELARCTGLVIITNSLKIAECLGESGNRVFMIGGEFLPESAQNVGTLAQEQILRFNTTHAVITIGALNTEGAMDYCIEEADIARAMVAQAQQITVIADASKLGKRGLFKVFPLERISRLIINRQPDDALMQALHQARVDVRVTPTIINSDQL